MIAIASETLGRLRAFAGEPGALLMPLRTEHGCIVLWADDINKAGTDAELTELIQRAAGDAASSGRRGRAEAKQENLSGEYVA